MKIVLLIDGLYEGNCPQINDYQEHIEYHKLIDQPNYYSEPISFISNFKVIEYKWIGISYIFDHQHIQFWSCNNSMIIGEKAILKLVEFTKIFRKPIHLPYKHIPWISEKWANDNKINLWYQNHHATLIY